MDIGELSVFASTCTSIPFIVDPTKLIMLKSVKIVESVSSPTAY